MFSTPTHLQTVVFWSQGENVHSWALWWMKDGFWLCIYAFCGLQGSAPSIESGSVWGFLWVLDGDSALVAAQSKCTYTLWELSAAIQKCQAQYQVDFTHKQVGPRPLCHLFCAVTSFFFFFLFFTHLSPVQKMRGCSGAGITRVHTHHIEECIHKESGCRFPLFAAWAFHLKFISLLWRSEETALIAESTFSLIINIFKI